MQTKLVIATGILAMGIASTWLIPGLGYADSENTDERSSDARSVVELVGEVHDESDAVDSESPTEEEFLHLDLDALEQKLRDTEALGFFTKLALKNDVDDLLSAIDENHRGGGAETMNELRERYDLLILKILSLLQDSDSELSEAIASSRSALWHLLADPVMFAVSQSQGVDP